MSPTDPRPQVIENYLRLFGQLPDIIRLHEQTGDFDGQVVFIGHPNRDVSAHQWLSASFQWVNIGLWSHNRKKIEGSLASDRYPNSGFSPNSIEYFKCVAEKRERMIKEHGRSQIEGEVHELRPRPTVSNIADARKPVVIAIPTGRTITGEKLEDPFVSTNNIAQPAPLASFNFRGDSQVGSMNFDYEFPSKPGATIKENKQIYRERERERLEALRMHLTPRCEPQSLLREIEFGEEAATGFTPPMARPNPRNDTLTSMETMQGPLEGGNMLTEGNRPKPRPGLPIEHRVAVPDFQLNNMNVRNSIPKGPTVANPYRGVSTLNAAAPPYQMPSREHQPEACDSSVAAPNLPVSTVDPSLRFSDPDGMRQENVHPIANGFNKQAPTKQNWSGPFFADSIPTAHDPTASLSLQTTDEQKLATWYRDGQTVSRQQDYAKTLITAALASMKARTFGAIGEGSAAKQTLLKYENTHLFARLYENLFEYKEESRAGKSSNYFTRAWKTPPPHLCDLGPEGNNSFYTSTKVYSPQLPRAPSRPYQPYRGENTPWGFSALGSHPCPMPVPYGRSTVTGSFAMPPGLNTTTTVSSLSDLCPFPMSVPDGRKTTGQEFGYMRGGS